MASRGLMAFGILAVSGFLGGFCLTSGSAHYFAPAADKPQAGGGGGEPSTGAAAAGGKQATQHGGLEKEGGTQPVIAAGGQTSGGKVAEEKGGPLEDGEDVKVAKPAEPAVTHEVADFLAGNTIELRDPDKAVFHRYMSKRGWMGDTDNVRGGLLVHRWLVRGNQMCEIASEQNVVCETLTIARERRPGPEAGAVIGSVTTATGQSWPVRRGNVAGMPEIMPLIDGARRLGKEPVPAKATVQGPAALKALVGRPLVREGRDGEPVSGVYYDPDGRWVRTQPIAAGALTGLGGIRVTIGRWSAHGNALCLDEPGLELTRRCFTAEQMGEAAFRLMPTPAKGATMALSVLAEGV